MNALKKLVYCFICLFFVPIFAFGADKEDFFSTAPLTNQGKKWRIGYYEGGEYKDYQNNFTGLLNGFITIGWLDIKEIPEQKGEQTKELWNWLSTNAKSKYIDFVKDAHYTANWDDNLRKKISAEIINRLNQKKDIDLMLAMGSWAGMDLANNKHSTPTIVMGTANPLQSGIIKSIEDSGYEHIHARIDPFRYERQVRIFHDIIGFRRLGIMYEDTVIGRTYAAVDEVEKIAKERGIEIVRCFAKSDVAVEEAEKEAIKCFKELVRKADAIYVPVHGGITPKTIPELVDIVNTNHIPTFSITGSEEVKYGFLMSISLAGYRYVGTFYAETCAKIFNRAKPRQLSQIFEDPPKIAINLKAAEIIGYDPPVDVLGAADEIFQKILIPKK